MIKYLFCSSLILSPLIGLIIYKYQQITNYLIKSLNYYPGEGEIYKKQNPGTKKANYFIRNPNHDFRLNYITAPFFDMSIGLFTKDINIEENIMVTRDFFDKNYKEQKKHNLVNWKNGFIVDIYDTKNIKKGNLYGYIKCLTEEKIYLFVVKEGIFDLNKIFKEYENELLNGID